MKKKKISYEKNFETEIRAEPSCTIDTQHVHMCVCASSNNRELCAAYITGSRVDVSKFTIVKPAQHCAKNRTLLLLLLLSPRHYNVYIIIII